MSKAPGGPHGRRWGLLGQSALCSAAVGVALAAAGGPARALPQLAGAGSYQASADGVAPTVVTGSGELDVFIAAKRTLIDWTEFNTASNETTIFHFPAAGGVALNRVAQPVDIEGALQSVLPTGAFGGNVWIVAPSGIIFGPTAQVDVGGLLATTSSFTDDASFLDAANFNFGFLTPPASSSILIQNGARITGWGNTAPSGTSLAFISNQVTTEAGSAIGGTSVGNPSHPNPHPSETNVFYGAAQAYTVTFAPNADNNLDLVSFLVSSDADASSSLTPLTLAGTTTAGDIRAVAVSQIAVVNAVISAPGLMTATAAIGVGGDILLQAGGGTSFPGAQGVNPQITAGGGSAAGNITLRTNGGNITFGNMSAGGFMVVNSAGSSVVGGSIFAGNLTAGGPVSLFSSSDTSGDVTATDVTSTGGRINITAEDGNGPGGNISATRLQALDNITLDTSAGGAIVADTLSSNASVNLSTHSPGSLSSGVSGSIDAHNIHAGLAINMDSTGSISGGAITAGNISAVADSFLTSGGGSDGGAISVTGASGAGNLTLTSGDTSTSGSTGGNISLTGVSLTGDLSVDSSGAATGGSITVTNASVTGDIDINAQGGTTGGNVSASNVSLTGNLGINSGGGSDGGGVQVANVSATGDLGIRAGGLSSAGNITVTGASVTGDLDVSATSGLRGGAISVTNANVAGDVDIDSGADGGAAGALSGGNISAAGNITIHAIGLTGGSANFTILSTSGFLDINTGGFTTGGRITVDQAVAAGDLTLTSGQPSNGAAGAINATNLLGGNISIVSSGSTAGAITVRSADATHTISLAADSSSGNGTGGNISGRSLKGVDIAAESLGVNGGNIALTDLNATGVTTIDAEGSTGKGGAVSYTLSEANDLVSIETGGFAGGGNVTVNFIQGNASMTVTTSSAGGAGGSVDLEESEFGGGVTISSQGAAGGAITVGNLTAISLIDLISSGTTTTGGAIQADNVHTAGDLVMQSGEGLSSSPAVGGAITATNIGGAHLTIDSSSATGGAINVTGATSTNDATVTSSATTGAAGAIQLHDVNSQGLLTVTASGVTGGNVTAGNVTSSGNMSINTASPVGGAISVTGLSSGEDISLNSIGTTGRGGAISADGVTATGNLTLQSGTGSGGPGGNITAGNLSAGSLSQPAFISITADGASGGGVSVHDAHATGGMVVTSNSAAGAGGDITGGNLSSDAYLTIEALGGTGGKLLLDGLSTPGEIILDTEGFVGAGGSINVANTTSGGSIGIISRGVTTGGAISATNLHSDGDVNFFSGGGVSGGAGGNISAGNVSSGGVLTLDASGSTAGDISAHGLSGAGVSVLAQGGVGSGGTINLTDSTTTGAFFVYSGGATGGAITAGNLSSGGALTLNASGSIAGNISAHGLSGASVSVLAQGGSGSGGTIGVSDSTATGAFIVNSRGATGGNITLGNLSSGGEISVDSGGDPGAAGSITATGLTVGDTLEIGAAGEPGGAVSLHDIHTTFDVRLNNGSSSHAGGSVILGNITAGSRILISTFGSVGGNISATGLNAADDIALSSLGSGGPAGRGGVIDVNDAHSAENVYINAGNTDGTVGDVIVGNASAGQAIIIGGLNIDAGTLVAGTDVIAVAIDGGHANVGDATAGMSVYVVATDGSASLGNVTLTGAGLTSSGGVNDEGFIVEVGGTPVNDTEIGMGADNSPTHSLVIANDTVPRVLVSASGAAGDASLGLGTGSINGAGAPTALVDVIGSRNTTVDVVGDAILNSVSAPNGTLTLSATGVVAVDHAQGLDIDVIANGLSIGSSLAGAQTVTIQSRSGGVALGDNTGVIGGFHLNANSFSRISAGQNLTIYGGTIGGPTLGDITVGDLSFDPGQIPQLTLLAGPTHTVNITGAFAPSVTGGALIIGGAPSWTPGSILVSGSIGSATGSAVSGFSNVRAFGSVRLTAHDDILFGSDDFISAAQATLGKTINVNHGIPNVPLASGELNHLFLTAGRATLEADGKIVQQNTGAPGQFNGLYLTNTTGGGQLLPTVLTLGGDPPSVIDLSGALVTLHGQLVTGPQAALSLPTIAFESGLTINPHYQFNGCPIGLGCSQVTAVKTLVYPDIAQPNLVVEDLSLTAEDVTTPDEANPDVVGAGNEEIWRKHHR